MRYLLNHDRVAGSGLYIRAIAGENLGNRKLVYLDITGTWSLADADAVASMPAVGLTMHAFTSGKPGWILTKGWIGLLTWTWIVGGAIYASTTPGELTQTKPSAQEYPNIQSVGIASTATQIRFDPGLKSDVLNDVVMMTDNNWDDLRFPASAIRLPGANAPTVTAYKGGQVLAFVDNADNFIYVIAQLPHAWEEGTDISVHLHWTPQVAGGAAGVENVKWDLTHSWANEQGTFPGEAAITVTRDVQNDAVDTHLVTTFADISATGKTFSSILILSLKRDTGVANNYGSDAFLVEIDIHYKRNRLGTYAT